MAEEKNESKWLQFFDNTIVDSDNDDDDGKLNPFEKSKKQKKFNTNNIEDVEYNPYRFTLSNNESDKETIKLYSPKDIEQMIKDYKQKYNSKLCQTCGQHFNTYSERDIHDGYKLFRSDKACKPIFNINNYDKNNVDKTFHSNLTVYIHFNQKRLDEIQGLKSLITDKLKGEIELLPSNIFTTDADKYICFAVPIFSFEAVNKCLYFAMITSYDLEIWYEALYEKNRDYTPQSKYLKLEEDELDALQSLHLSHRFRSSLKPEDNSIISRLTRKLDKIIKQFTDELTNDKEFNAEIFSIGEYFVKLSTRSPKDGTGVNPKTYPNTTRLERILLMMEKMKIKQADQINELIEKSERVYGDIGFYHHYTIAFCHSLNLIIRCFFKRLNPIFEFRCFIRGKQLNCISQYLCYDVFKELQDVGLVSNIRDEIISFHNNVKDILPYNDYVMDVFVDILNNEEEEEEEEEKKQDKNDKDDKNKDMKRKMKVYIVEINPFGACSSSGSALFEWKTDFDLLYGNVDDQQMLPIFRVAQSNENDKQ